MGQAGSAVRGTTPRSSGSGGTSNQPPILFHQVHGDNIRISRDGTVARCAETCLKGVTFSNRPIKVAETVCVKFLELSIYWSRIISFGFTSNDPNNLRFHLPKSACKDLSNEPGYWIKTLPERYAERDTVLFYYVTRAGDVHFGINGEEKGVFFSGVKTRGPLWAIIEIYGDSTAINLVDPRQQLKITRRNLLTGVDTSPGDPAATERLIRPPLAALSINQQNRQQPQSQRSAKVNATNNDMTSSRFQQARTFFNPLPFHTTHGRNIRLSNDRFIASRADTVFRHGYVFTARPVQLGEKVVLQVLATNPMRYGALVFGLTSSDPAMLRRADLADDSDILLDPSEYWVVSKDAAICPLEGDEFSFCITHTGEVQFSKNGSTPIVFMHVDQTIPLWAFVDLFGSTKKVRILSSCVEPLHPHTSSGSRNLSAPPRAIVPAEATRLRRAKTVSVTNQRPPPAVTTHHHLQSSKPSVPVDLHPASSGNLPSTYRHTYIEEVSAKSYAMLDSKVPTQQYAYATAAGGGSGTECIICCERPINSLFYTCGHMCMCYECAVQQWRGMGNGDCPICRTVIGNVIRAHKSK